MPLRKTTHRLTIHDVAATAGVSTGTVSRVIRDSPKVARATRERVLEAMQELGFQPNAAARSMRTNDSHIIGLLIPDILSPTFARVAAGAESVLSPKGYLLLIGSSNRSVSQEVAFLQIARQRQMDGVIVSPSDETAQETIRELTHLDVPIVMLDRNIAIGSDAVFSEHADAMDVAVAHLLSLGHRRIAYIGPSLSIRPSRERIAGFRRAHARAGLTVDDTLLRCDSQNVNFGEIETTALLALPDPPTALIGGSGDIFYGVVRALRMLDMAIPAQLSLIGVDDQLFAEMMGPPVSVIARDMVRTGAEAARLILNRLANPTAPRRHITLPSTFILRHSTAAPAGRLRCP